VGWVAWTGGSPVELGGLCEQVRCS